MKRRTDVVADVSRALERAAAAEGSRLARMAEYAEQRIAEMAPETSATFALLAGEWLADPTSTKRRIYGPATVTVWKYRDGGLTVSIERSGR